MDDRLWNAVRNAVRRWRQKAQSRAEDDRRRRATVSSLSRRMHQRVHIVLWNGVNS